MTAGRSSQRHHAGGVIDGRSKSVVVDHVRGRVAQWYEAGAPDVDLQPRSWHLCPICGHGYAPL